MLLHLQQQGRGVPLLRLKKGNEQAGPAVAAKAVYGAPLGAAQVSKPNFAKGVTQRACAPACRRLNNKISARRTRERRSFQLRKLEEENDVLGRQILMLQQQVTELRSANHVLLQNLPQISDHQRCLNSPEHHACLPL